MMKAAALFATAAAYESEWQEFQAVQGARNGAIPAAFKANVDIVKAHNSQDSSSKMSYTGPFAALSQDDFKEQFLTGLQGEVSHEAAHLGKHVYSGAVLPDSIDWSQQGAVTPIKNQGQCGSCWAFSTVGSLEGRNQIATQNLVSLSEQQFVDCDKVDQGCNGGLMDNAFKYVMNSGGACTENSYGYTGRDGSCQASSCTVGVQSSAITGYKDVDGTEEALAEAVAQGPVSVAVDAESKFQLYSGGIVTSNCGTSLDHGVLTVGYGEESGTKYWKVKNSWGASWGEDGYIRLLKGKGGAGECGILTGPPSYPVIASSVAV